ncbi:putative phosphatidylinositol 3,4,5-trisphosphate 3-phosphatase TPTE2P1 [Plecturocebus cupreus]
MEGRREDDVLQKTHSFMKTRVRKQKVSIPCGAGKHFRRLRPVEHLRAGVEDQPDQRDEMSLCHPGWSAVAQSHLTATSASLVEVILLPQPRPRPQSSRDYRKQPFAQVKIGTVLTYSTENTSGFHHVGQAGLKLLTSVYLPPLASQSTEITGVTVVPAIGEVEVEGSLELQRSRMQ